MGNIKMNILLEENDAYIKIKIIELLKDQLDIFNKKLVKKLQNPIRNIIRNSLLSQPEVISLSNGELASHFGLPDGMNRISNIINIFANQVYVKYVDLKQSSKFMIKSFISIDIIKSDYLEALSSSDASLTTEDGKELHWLEWLLLFGDRIIVRDYYINFDFKKAADSRTGKAVMIKKIGSSWNVPSEFAGVHDNNFVTRALYDIDKNIIAIIEKEARSI